MTVTRRRFLTISAAFAAMPVTAQAHSWQGRAFGADLSLTIRGPRAEAKAAINAARDLMAQIERLFSLYDPASDLVRLNQTGALATPDARFVKLMQLADWAHRQTDGLFDPSVQPLWRAMAEGRDTGPARAAIGWNRVRFDHTHITLGTGQALTFNGIAQGYATDVVSDAFAALGLRETLVNIGEYRGVGGPWVLGIQDPRHGHMGTRTLTNAAIATSSPQSTPLGRDGHILHPLARPRWSTVSVEAPRASVADSLSTAMVLAGRDQIEAIKARTDIGRVTLVDFDGNLSTL